MTFRPEQIQKTEDWLRQHQAHEVVEQTDRYPLSDGHEKLMHWKVCKTCGKRHLFNMETT